MDVRIIGLAIIVYLASLGVVYVLTTKRSDKKIQQYRTLTEAISTAVTEKQRAENALTGELEKIKQAEEAFTRLDAETKDLQVLRNNAGSIADQLAKDRAALDEVEALIAQHQKSVEEKETAIHEIMSKIDLYSRLDTFVEYGHFEVPEYLYETGERFSAEIKILRDKQKSMIKESSAFAQEGEVNLTGDGRVDKKIIDGQMKLILRAFNIECDMLIGKVSPANFDRTLGRIEKLANDLEKLVASLRCGISIDYVALKYEECGIQYQYTLKKKDEQEEQKLIREQMREEARAEKEYRNALDAAEKEEKLYRDILEKARKELGQSTVEERALVEARVAELEQRLAEAEAKENRVKSLAEQTRRGHVYVISNVGSFGEHVYKIGMTRRLDPMDRVKELGDASVPFSFDVHAIIFSDDAPAMETSLHRKFRNHRVNAVNLRKEFFRVELNRIRDAVEEIGGEEADFKTTIVAEEFFETNRLRERTVA
ncbi:DUF4041 domain-containing protein [Salinicola corii]|uniref:DUF4041 domain-containing protein n=1 Tax=Salinicola corii TaxID=2606937 RepID=A0A640WA01_9GAMM|nr:DUF4041 domain-containing protein [Salinicola corii]KAA0015895.1 DUF4041 domain-containing protein [Salinicola corii]